MADAPRDGSDMVLRCRDCWQQLGPDHKIEEAKPAVIVALGFSLCEEHARRKWTAVWS